MTYRRTTIDLKDIGIAWDHEAAVAYTQDCIMVQQGLRCEAQMAESSVRLLSPTSQGSAAGGLKAHQLQGPGQTNGRSTVFLWHLQLHF